MTGFRPLSDLIAAALPDQAEHPAPAEVQRRVGDYWRAHLGAVGEHSRPLLFVSGRLVVFVEAAAWGNEIRFRARSLAAALRAQGIEAGEVEVKLQPGIREWIA